MPLVALFPFGVCIETSNLPREPGKSFHMIILCIELYNRVWAGCALPENEAMPLAV